MVINMRNVMVIDKCICITNLPIIPGYPTSPLFPGIPVSPL